jgi:hypothetical protein
MRSTARCWFVRQQMVGRARFELAVSWSQTRRFSELSYRPRFARSILLSDHIDLGV